MTLPRPALSLCLLCLACQHPAAPHIAAAAPLARGHAEPPKGNDTEPLVTPSFGYERLGDVSVFYREAGPTDAPTLLLLHGFPSSSHQYRQLIQGLGKDIHVVAPDYPGFGFSEAPSDFQYTFDSLADVVEAFCRQRSITNFFVYLFDFGAPVGLRLALRHPEWIRGIITQNGNAHEESIAPDIARMIQLDATTSPGPATEARRAILTLDATKSQYFAGAVHPERVAPEAWLLDQHLLDRPGRAEAMLALLDDYKINVAAYPAWQRYLRERKPPTLIAWGEDDPIFLEAGAHAWKRDVPTAELHLLPGGHFLLEERAADVARLVRDFVHRTDRAGRGGR